jgi:hypothetical protein
MGNRRSLNRKVPGADNGGNRASGPFGIAKLAQAR